MPIYPPGTWLNPDDPAGHGTVTAGRFTIPYSGGRFDRHHHDDDELWFFSSGKAPILVDGALLGSVERTRFVDRLADDVHDAAQRLMSDRNRDRRAGVVDTLPTDQTFGRVHGDRANGVFAEVLCDFENQTIAVVVGFKRVQDRRELAFESNVHNGADNLRNLTDRTCRGSCVSHILTLFP